jgi:hypothetical protein
MGDSDCMHMKDRNVGRLRCGSSFQVLGLGFMGEVLCDFVRVFAQYGWEKNDV